MNRGIHVARTTVRQGYRGRYLLADGAREFFDVEQQGWCWPQPVDDQIQKSKHQALSILFNLQVTYCLHGLQLVLSCLVVLVAVLRAVGNTLLSYTKLLGARRSQAWLGECNQSKAKPQCNLLERSADVSSEPWAWSGVVVVVSPCTLSLSQQLWIW